MSTIGTLKSTNVVLLCFTSSLAWAPTLFSVSVLYPYLRGPAQISKMNLPFLYSCNFLFSFSSPPLSQVLDLGFCVYQGIQDSLELDHASLWGLKL